MAETEKKTIGNEGEDAACSFLRRNGYKILNRNYREKYGEIDIIARSKDKTLVFIEVKTLTNNVYQTLGLVPEDNATAAKIEKTRRICEMFANKHPELMDEKKGWRIDLVSILLDSGKDPEIRHYENIG